MLVVGSLGGGLVDGSCRVSGGSLCAFPFGSRHPHRSWPLISGPFQICCDLHISWLLIRCFHAGGLGFFFWCFCSFVFNVLCRVGFVRIACFMFLFDLRLGDR